MTYFPSAPMQFNLQRGLVIYYKHALVNLIQPARRIVPIMRLFLSLCLFGAVLGTTLHSAVNTLSIVCAADDVIANAGEVLNTAAPDKHYAVLLKVVTFTEYKP